MQTGKLFRQRLMEVEQIFIVSGDYGSLRGFLCWITNVMKCASFNNNVFCALGALLNELVTFPNRSLDTALADYEEKRRCTTLNR
jgi:hypothetical protein